MTEDVSELFQLRQKAHEWIDALQISGITENAAVAALITVVAERAIRSSGVEPTAMWLRSQATMVEQFGPEMLKEIGARERSRGY